MVFNAVGHKYQRYKPIISKSSEPFAPLISPQGGAPEWCLLLCSPHELVWYILPKTQSNIYIYIYKKNIFFPLAYEKSFSCRHAWINIGLVARLIVRHDVSVLRTGCINCQFVPPWFIHGSAACRSHAGGQKRTQGTGKPFVKGSGILFRCSSAESTRAILAD